MRELTAIRNHLQFRRNIRVEFADDTLTGSPLVFNAKTGEALLAAELPADDQNAIKLWGLLLQYADGVIDKEAFDAAGASALRKSFKKREKPVTAEHALRLVRNLLPAIEHRVSRRGVPHLVLGDKSVAWFANEQQYRVFEGYGDFSKPQKRYNYETAAEVVAHLAPVSDDPAMGYCLTLDMKTGKGCAHALPVPEVSGGGFLYTAVSRLHP